MLIGYYRLLAAKRTSLSVRSLVRKSKLKSPKQVVRSRHIMASVHFIGPISYTSDQVNRLYCVNGLVVHFLVLQNFSKVTQRFHPKKQKILFLQAILSTSNGNHQSIFNSQDIALNTASAAQAVNVLTAHTAPVVILNSDETIASGLALIYLATRARLAPEDAIRLGNVLQLPAINSTSQDIAQWVSTSIQEIVAGNTESFIFKQLFDPKSSTFTYILADSDTKDAVIIDPVYEQVERDLKVAEELGLNVLYALNTHCHADHVTGTGKLKESLSNLKSCISAISQAKADIAFNHGDEFVFGKHKLTVITTPGHTDGCVSFFTKSNGGCIFTGDALLIRGCGRTDFQQGNASTLYESVHNNILTLDPKTTVYPTPLMNTEIVLKVLLLKKSCSILG